MWLRQTGPSRCNKPSITSLPVDHVVQLPAIPISTKIVAEHIYSAVLALIAAVRDMWRDQYPAIRPEKRHWRALELADIDIERRAAQMVAFERAEERVLIDDLAPRDVDQHAVGLHRREAVLVEQAGCVRGPLTAYCDEIALRQKPVESLRPADFAKAVRQGRAGLQLTAGADNTHAKRGAEPAHFGSDPASA